MRVDGLMWCKSNKANVDALPAVSHDSPAARSVQNTEAKVIGTTPIRLIWFLPLLVPFLLFAISLHIRPTINPDSSTGFLALRSMLQGGAFNYVITPDPANIANDSASFLTWWSPGQYLVPAAFILLGADYYLAISLTTLIAIITGVIGWVQVARNFAASPFVIILLLCGLVTFRYSTLPFQMWDGGEVLLFAAAPWCLYWLQWAMREPPMICFLISLMSVALLFIAKLTGLAVFAADVLSLTLLELIRQRRVTSSMLAMVIASGIAALSFVLFWQSRGSLPADGSKFAITLPAIWFPIAAAAFSGVSGIDLMNLLLHNWSVPILAKFTKYILGLLGLLSAFWAWYQLRNTRYFVIVVGALVVIVLMAGAASAVVGHKLVLLDRHRLRDVGLLVSGLLGLLLALLIWYRIRRTRYRIVAIGLFSIIALYTVALIAMYVHGAQISLEERHLRYAGILFFLLFLVTLDQWGTRMAKTISLLVVSAFAVYGLTTYASNASELLQGRYYGQLDFTIQQTVPSTALQYLRSELETHNWQRAIAVLPREAALSLPQFRIIPVDLNIIPPEKLSEYRWSGRAEKVFVVVPEQALADGQADVLLRNFVDYDESAWSKVQIDGMVIYSQ